MAIQFDGSTNYVTIANSPSPAELYLPAGDWTIGLWVYRDVATGSSSQYLFTCNGFGATDSWGARFTSNLPQTVAKNSTTQYVCTGAASVGAGVWTHLLFEHDSANAALKTYINGVQSGSPAADTGWVADQPVSPVILAQFAGVCSAIRIEDFAGWSRILTSQERADLYSGAVVPRDLATSRLWLYELRGDYTEASGGTTAAPTGSPAFVDGPHPNNPPTVTIPEKTTVGPTITLPVGAQFQLNAVVTDEDDPPPTPAWNSATPAAATVSATGLVIAVAEGTSRVTASATDLNGNLGSDYVDIVVDNTPAAGGGFDAARHIINAMGGTL